MSESEKDEIARLKQEILYLQGGALDLKGENGQLIIPHEIEPVIARMVEEFVKPDDCILELGGRTGSVSCLINKKLTNPANHVVLEPDPTVQDLIKSNRDANECKFQIIEGVVGEEPLRLMGSGEQTTSIPCSPAYEPVLDYTVDYLQGLVSTPFTGLIADCEGCLKYFFPQNKEFIKSLRVFIFEKDCPQKTAYPEIEKYLTEIRRLSCVGNSGFYSAWTSRLDVLKSKNITPTSKRVPQARRK